MNDNLIYFKIRVFKTKNKKLIPIPSTLFGFLCSANWFSFGLVVNDIAIMIPNGLGVVFNLINILTLIFLPKSEIDIALDNDIKENLNCQDKITNEEIII
jgi:hypothetical protein